MKRSIFVLIALFFSVALLSNDVTAKERWSIIEYDYSSGPVSPEYFYSMKIIVNRDGTASISYSTSGRAAFDTKQETFKVSRNNLNRITAAINRSRIMKVSPGDMERDGQPLIGGQKRTVTLTIENTNPNLDQPPRTVTTPQQVKDQYSRNLNNLYDLIESIVPTKVLNDVKSRP